MQLVADDRVLTTEQWTVLAFGSRTRAQHRLQELHELRAHCAPAARPARRRLSTSTRRAPSSSRVSRPGWWGPWKR